ncbi:hypothetical protein NA56DRAFT_703469 [Hyaloscypha hepaticicola]|uniref:Uncharacterized protein n=1 Tax=Hyaloscypha hepaticicola TaxID=2082293 RepID=A0A2J6Q542_9HELO|nr:hypothetical protein NA56DRAFT_703469 [Hyaloscypha hepaticicola]
MNAPPARYNVAPRSANAPDVLIRPCCLRCSKNLAKDPTLQCVKQGNRSVCNRYRSLNKPCFNVPQACIPRLNRLMREVDAALALPANTPARTAAVASVTAHQATYTSRVEAVVRAARTTLDGIVDVLRYQNNLPPISRDNPDNDDDNEDGGDTDGEEGAANA